MAWVQGKLTAKTVPLVVLILLLIWFARPTPGFFGTGLAVVILGEALRAWAAGHLRKNEEVTTSGPYAHVKNPLYLGTLLILIGFCVMAANLWGLAIGVPLFFLYYVPYKRTRESARLEARFGERWHAYNEAVPDYLPRLSRYRDAAPVRWSLELFRRNSEHGTAAAVAGGVLLLAVKVAGG